jgi:hypothetical protein
MGSSHAHTARVKIATRFPLFASDEHRLADIMRLGLDTLQQLTQEVPREAELQN